MISRDGSQADDSGAAILCQHVARGDRSILLAERCAPEDDRDSGWQFLCDSGPTEDPAKAEVWSLAEVLHRDPTIRSLLQHAEGLFSREGVGHPWRKVR